MKSAPNYTSIGKTSVLSILLMFFVFGCQKDFQKNTEDLDDYDKDVDRYKTDQLIDKSMVINAKGHAIRVHSDVRFVNWAEAGRGNPDGSDIKWFPQEAISYGVDPTVDMTDDDIAVFASGLYRGDGDVYYAVGVYKEYPHLEHPVIGHGDFVKFGEGIYPDIAINNNYIVVGLFSKQSDHKMYYRVGLINYAYKTVSFDKTYYIDKVQDNLPRVTIGDDDVVEVSYKDFETGKTVVKKGIAIKDKKRIDWFKD